MVIKYQEAVKRPYKMKVNREFMMMMKILLMESVTDVKPTKGEALKGQGNLLAKCPPLYPI